MTILFGKARADQEILTFEVVDAPLENATGSVEQGAGA